MATGGARPQPTGPPGPRRRALAGRPRRHREIVEALQEDVALAEAGGFSGNTELRLTIVRPSDAATVEDDLATADRAGRLLLAVTVGLGLLGVVVARRRRRAAATWFRALAVGQVLTAVVVLSLRGAVAAAVAQDRFDDLARDVAARFTSDLVTRSLVLAVVLTLLAAASTGLAAIHRREPSPPHPT